MSSKNKSLHFSPLWCTKAASAQTQCRAHSMREGPWDDIGVFYLKQSVYSCVQARHCIEYNRAGATALQPTLRCARSGGCGAASPTSSVNDRRKESTSIPNARLFSSPEKNPELNLRLAHPCFADRNCSFTELINKPNSQSIAMQTDKNPGLLILLIAEQTL